MLFYKKNDIALQWVSISCEFSSSNNQFMNNLLLMFINNQTLTDFSASTKTNDYITYIFNQLKNLYEGDKFFYSINEMALLSDNNIDYDCLKFYQNLDNEYFNQLKNEFIGEEIKLYTTMIFFCEWSSVMMFKKYKTIYLQLFNQVKILMENFKNDSYNNIVLFIYKNDIVKIEIIFLITYVHLMDIIYKNRDFLLNTMVDGIKKNIIINIITFIAILIFLILIIIFVYIRNVNNDCKKFINAKKAFKVCNIYE